ncbi:MAG: hypothetical protein ACI86X_001167 [Moritella sp.]|jgi:hypothetical protein
MLYPNHLKILASCINPTRSKKAQFCNHTFLFISLMPSRYCHPLIELIVIPINFDKVTFDYIAIFIRLRFLLERI